MWVEKQSSQQLGCFYPSENELLPHRLVVLATGCMGGRVGCGGTQHHFDVWSVGKQSREGDRSAGFIRSTEANAKRLTEGAHHWLDTHTHTHMRTRAHTHLCKC